MTGAIPTTIAQWWAVIRMDAGALLGWLLTPTLWLVAGPLRWLALVNVCAAQESSYNPDAEGDGGRSIGILQFYDETWSMMDGWLDVPAKDRKSPFWSGYAAARYVRRGLWSDPWTWTIAVPLWGVPAIRHYWTHGTARGAGPADLEGYVLVAAGFWGALRALVLVPLLLMWWRRR